MCETVPGCASAVVFFHAVNWRACPAATSAVLVSCSESQELHTGLMDLRCRCGGRALAAHGPGRGDAGSGMSLLAKWVTWLTRSISGPPECCYLPDDAPDRALRQLACQHWRVRCLSAAVLSALWRAGARVAAREVLGAPAGKFARGRAPAGGDCRSGCPATRLARCRCRSEELPIL